MKAQSLNTSEQTAIMMRGNSWSYQFLTFALLIDIMYRAMVFQEVAWDLYALLFVSGIISLGYAIRHDILILNRTNVFAMALLLLLAATIAAVVAYAYLLSRRWV